MARSKDNRFRNGIQKCRIAAGYSSAQSLALRIKLSKGTVESWEQGFAFPRPEQVVQLADLLNCSIDELYGRGRPAGRTEAAPSGLSSLDDINDSGRKAIDLLIDVLNGDEVSIDSTILTTLITLVNQSLADKRGAGASSPVSAAV